MGNLQLDVYAGYLLIVLEALTRNMAVEGYSSAVVGSGAALLHHNS